MADLVDGTDNVYVLGVKDTNTVIPATTTQMVDDMLTESLAIQYTSINDFLDDLREIRDTEDIVKYGMLMKHLQSECVFHLSALAAGAIIMIEEAMKGPIA